MSGEPHRRATIVALIQESLLLLTLLLLQRGVARVSPTRSVRNAQSHSSSRCQSGRLGADRLPFLRRCTWESLEPTTATWGNTVTHHVKQTHTFLPAKAGGEKWSCVGTCTWSVFLAAPSSCVPATQARSRPAGSWLQHKGPWRQEAVAQWQAEPTNDHPLTPPLVMHLNLFQCYDNVGYNR